MEGLCWDFLEDGNIGFAECGQVDQGVWILASRVPLNEKAGARQSTLYVPESFAVLLEVVKCPSEERPVTVQVPGGIGKGAPETAGHTNPPVGIEELPANCPIEFRELGLIPEKVILPLSDSFPVTRSSSALDIWVNAPVTWVEPRVPEIVPPMTTPVHVIFPKE